MKYLIIPSHMADYHPEKVIPDIDSEPVVMVDDDDNVTVTVSFRQEDTCIIRVVGAYNGCRKVDTIVTPDTNSPLMIRHRKLMDIGSGASAINYMESPPTNPALDSTMEFILGKYKTGTRVHHTYLIDTILDQYSDTIDGLSITRVYGIPHIHDNGIGRLFYLSQPVDTDTPSVVTLSLIDGPVDTLKNVLVPCEIDLDIIDTLRCGYTTVDISTMSPDDVINRVLENLPPKTNFQCERLNELTKLVIRQWMRGAIHANVVKLSSENMSEIERIYYKHTSVLTGVWQVGKYVDISVPLGLLVVSSTNDECVGENTAIHSMLDEMLPYL